MSKLHKKKLQQNNKHLNKQAIRKSSFNNICCVLAKPAGNIIFSPFI